MAQFKNKLFSSYLAMIAFPVWMTIIMFPFITKGDWYEWKELSSTMIYYHYSGIIIFGLLLLAHRPLLIFQCGILKFKGLPNILINVFFGFLIFSSVFSLDIFKSLIYTVATYLTILLFSRLWLEPWPNIRSGLFILGVIIFGLLGAAILLHGLPQNRWIGGIQPNQFSGFALAGMLALFFQGAKTRIIAYILALSCVLLVNSRGGILAVLDFGVCYAAFMLIGHRTTKQVIVIAFIFSAAFFVLAGFLDTIWETVVSVTKIYDPDRGLGSGLTGRSRDWSILFAMIAERPFTGYGFRTERGLSLLIHNAYIKLFLQVGFIAGITFILVILIQAYRMAVNGIRLAKIDKEKANTFCVIASGVIMITINGFLESIMINIGFPLPIMFLFLLTAPIQPLFSKSRKRMEWDQGNAIPGY